MENDTKFKIIKHLPLLNKGTKQGHSENTNKNKKDNDFN